MSNSLTELLIVISKFATFFLYVELFIRISWKYVCLLGHIIDRLVFLMKCLEHYTDFNYG